MRFVEKPDRARAERMLREGYLWNSGIFVWRVGDFLEESRERTRPKSPAHCERAAATDLRRFFDAVRPIAVEYGVMERSARVLVLPGDFGWDDVGTWGALHRVRSLDATSNAVRRRTCTRSTHATTSSTRMRERSCCTAFTTSSS